MANPLLLVLGVILIGVSTLFFVSSVPHIANETRTGAGTQYENVSTGTQNAISVVGSLAILIPVVVFLGGLTIILAGI